MGFKFKEIRDLGVVLIERDKFGDSRGVFSEIYKSSLFSKSPLNLSFNQDNLVHSKANVLRGLHYQNPPYPQGKLLTVIEGDIFDVCVDIRNNSDTYGTYFSINLSSEDNLAIYIPEGFAHGYCTVSDEAIISYKTTSEYNKSSESGIIWNDKSLDINWPIEKPILSDFDKNLGPFIGSDGSKIHKL